MGMIDLKSFAPGEIGLPKGGSVSCCRNDWHRKLRINQWWNLRMILYNASQLLLSTAVAIRAGHRRQFEFVTVLLPIVGCSQGRKRSTPHFQRIEDSARCPIANHIYAVTAVVLDAWKPRSTGTRPCFLMIESGKHTFVRGRHKDTLK